APPQAQRPPEPERPAGQYLPGAQPRLALVAEAAEPHRPRPARPPALPPGPPPGRDVKHDEAARQLWAPVFAAARAPAPAAPARLLPGRPLVAAHRPRYRVERRSRAVGVGPVAGTDRRLGERRRDAAE